MPITGYERHILRLMHEQRQQEIEIDALKKKLASADQCIRGLEKDIALRRLDRDGEKP